MTNVLVLLLSDLKQFNYQMKIEDNTLIESI